MKYSRTCKQLYHWLRGQSVRSLTGAKKKNLDRIFSREWNGMKTRRMKERKAKRILLDIRVYIYIHFHENGEEWRMVVEELSSLDETERKRV